MLGRHAEVIDEIGEREAGRGQLNVSAAGTDECSDGNCECSGADEKTGEESVLGADRTHTVGGHLGDEGVADEGANVNHPIKVVEEDVLLLGFLWLGDVELVPAHCHYVGFDAATSKTNQPKEGEHEQPFILECWVRRYGHQRGANDVNERKDDD
jgi:hypothetical protein